MEDQTSVSVRGLDLIEVARALYAGSKAQGLGVLHFEPGDLTRQEAEEVLGIGVDGIPTLYMDYVKGRVIKVDLVHLRGEEQTFVSCGYDRDLGAGAAQRQIDELRNRGGVWS